MSILRVELFLQKNRIFKNYFYLYALKNICLFQKQFVTSKLIV